MTKAVTPTIMPSSVSAERNLCAQMAATAQSVPHASGFYLSITTAGITQIGQFLQKMQTAGY